MTNLNGDSGELVEGNICPRDSCYRREPCPPEIRFICEYEYDTPKENETPKSDLVEQLENCAIIFEGEPDLADIFIRALSNHAELSERVTNLEAGLRQFLGRGCVSLEIENAIRDLLTDTGEPK